MLVKALTEVNRLDLIPKVLLKSVISYWNEFDILANLSTCCLRCSNLFWEEAEWDYWDLFLRKIEEAGDYSKSLMSKRCISWHKLKAKVFWRLLLTKVFFSPEKKK